MQQGDTQSESEAQPQKENVGQKDQDSSSPEKATSSLGKSANDDGEESKPVAEESIDLWLDRVTPSWIHPDMTMILMVAFEAIMIILFFALADYSDENENLNQGIDATYSFYIGIHLMVYIGFGYLMTFLRRNGFEALGYTMLLSAICFQWGILNQAFWERVHEDHFHTLKLNVFWLVEGDFAAATFLITFGVLLGKATKLQLFLVAIPEIMIYAFNFYLFSWVLEGVDMGGSVVIHLAGAIFGLGVSYTLFSGHEGAAKDNSSSYSSDRFSIIGTLILWLYWPSFNGALAGDNQDRVAINTVFSLTGSAIAAFCTSKTFRPSGKFEMVDIANATLAGGVAVGSSADLVIGPGAAILIGCTAGFVSTLGFIHLTPYLEAKFGLTDTCGVLNLHGTPGLIGSLAGVIATAAADKSIYGKDFDSIFPHGDDQWGYQLAGLFATIGVMGISGILVGAAVEKVTRGSARPQDQLFCDHGEFEINTVEYHLIQQMEDEETLTKEQIAEQ